jgi:hypothetical protein
MWCGSTPKGWIYGQIDILEGNNRIFLIDKPKKGYLK